MRIKLKYCLHNYVKQHSIKRKACTQCITIYFIETYKLAEPDDFDKI
jgi:hypothetical protein